MNIGRRWKILLLWYSIILFFLYLYATRPPPLYQILYPAGPFSPLKSRARPGLLQWLLRYCNKFTVICSNRQRFFCPFRNGRFFIQLRWRTLVLKHTKRSTSKLLDFSLTVYTQYTRLETTYRDSGKIKKNENHTCVIR